MVSLSNLFKKALSVFLFLVFILHQCQGSTLSTCPLNSPAHPDQACNRVANKEVANKEVPTKRFPLECLAGMAPRVHFEVPTGSDD